MGNEGDVRSARRSNRVIPSSELGRSIIRDSRFVAVLVAGLCVLVFASAARADTTIVGSTTLVSNSPNIDLLGQNIAVFQGDAAGGYVLASPTAGTVVSWSFRSGGIAPGKTFVLRVLRPAGGGWTAVATSGPAAISSAAGTDAVQGPFATSLPVQAGDRIGLQPVDDANTPIETGVSGADGIRYFSAPLADGASAMLAPGAGMDNGQVVPVQATVQFTPNQPGGGPPPPPQPPQPPQNQVPPHITGTPAAAQTLTCDPGSWGGTGPFTYTQTWNQRTLQPAFHGIHGQRPPATYVTRQAGTGPTLVVADLAPNTSTITCTVTAHGSAGTTNADTAPVTVQATAPVPAPRRLGHRVVPARPVISLSPVAGVGVVGTCSKGTWLHYPVRFRFFWYSGGRVVGHAQRYRLRRTDAHRLLRCRVYAYNAAGRGLAISAPVPVP